MVPPHLSNQYQVHPYFHFDSDDMSIFAPFCCLFSQQFVISQMSCSLSVSSCLLFFVPPLSSPVCSTTCISYLIFLPSFSPCFYFPIFITPPLYFPSLFPFTPILLVLSTPIPLIRKFIPCFSFVSPAVTPVTCIALKYLTALLPAFFQRLFSPILS